MKSPEQWKDQWNIISWGAMTNECLLKMKSIPLFSSFLGERQREKDAGRGRWAERLTRQNPLAKVWWLAKADLVKFSSFFVCACANTHTRAHAGVWLPMISFSIVLQLSLGQRLTLNLELASSFKPTGQPAPGMHTPSTRMADVFLLHTWLFTWFLGLQTHAHNASTCRLFPPPSPVTGLLTALTHWWEHSSS